MISQNCPKCLSGRVRRGYRPTPWWSKFLFRYNLLCDNCNWEFRGFAVPFTVSAKPTKSPKKKVTNKAEDSATVDSMETLTPEIMTIESPAEASHNENPSEEQFKETSAEESLKTNVAQKSIPKSKRKKGAKAVADEDQAKLEIKPKAKKAKGKSGI